MRVSARRMLMKARQASTSLFTKAYSRVLRHYNDGCDLWLGRTRLKSGTREGRVLRCGPNTVHAWINHPDGSMTDLGLSLNLLTNIGRDWWSSQWGFIPAGFTASTASPATATSATSLTVTGTPLTASHLTATVQLGVAGMRIWCPVTGLTTPPVYGNIISNTTSVITVDQWWTVNGSGSDQTGSTPSSTAAFVISPGGMAAARYVALTTDTGAVSAADVVLASEITNNGAARALGTYAHTLGASSLTLSKTFSITGTITAIVKAGMFPCLTDTIGTTEAHGGPMLYETLLNQSATVGNGDSLALTWTVNPSG